MFRGQQRQPNTGLLHVLEGVTVVHRCFASLVPHHFVLLVRVHRVNADTETFRPTIFRGSLVDDLVDDHTVVSTLRKGLQIARAEKESVYGHATLLARRTARDRHVIAAVAILQTHPEVVVRIPEVVAALSVVVDAVELHLQELLIGVLHHEALVVRNDKWVVCQL